MIAGCLLQTMLLQEVDNAAFLFGLDDRTRARVETEGRVPIDDGTADTIAWSRKIHIVVTIVAVVTCVLRQGAAFFYLPTWFFLAGGILETTISGQQMARNIVHKAASATAAFFSFMGIWIVMKMYV